MKLEILQTVQPVLLVMQITPLVATLLGTIASICVGLITVKLLAFIPAKLTDDAEVNPEPLITTNVPGTPLAGVKPEIVRTSGTDTKTEFVVVQPVPVLVTTTE